MSSNRAWLMCFADLAFILLMVLVQNQGNATQRITDLQLPHSRSKEGESTISCQIRIRERQSSNTNVYQIIHTGNLKLEEERGPWISFARLQPQLQTLYARGLSLPHVVPRQYAMAVDLTLAVSLVNEIWQAPPETVTEYMKEVR